MKKILLALRTFFSGFRFRLTLWFTFILALVLAAYIASVYTTQVRDLRSQTLSRLEYNLNRLQAVYAFNIGSIILTTPAPDPSLVLQEDDILLIHDLNGNTLASYGPMSEKDVHALTKASSNPEFASNPYQITLSPHTGRKSGSDYICITASVLVGRTQAATLILGSPVDPGNQARRLLATLSLAGATLLAIAMFGGYWLADRAMRPVKSITQTARQISESDLTRRINLKATDELGLLASTFDAMLGRLQSAFERQRQFTADASHELRTPLTIINLETSHALAANRPAEEYQRSLGVIQAENEYMVRLVNDLLLLSRLDAGQFTIKQDPLDLSDLVVEVTERLAPLASRRGVEITLTDLPVTPINGDHNLLIQMISNLVENAIKYSPAQTGQVTLQTGLEGQTAWLRVGDNGPGISAEHQAHIFERFYRVDNVRSQNGGEDVPTGSGLGLSIVDWVARSHHGEICLTSAEGQGSTFEVRLRARP